MRSRPVGVQPLGYLSLLAVSTCLALALASPAAAAPLPRSSPLYNPGAPRVNENPNVTADYKGKIVLLMEAPMLGPQGAQEKRLAELEWDESVSGPVDQIEYTGVYGPKSIHWHMNTYKGKVEDNITEKGEKYDCSGTFSYRPSPTLDAGEQGVFLPLDEPGHPAGGGNPATNPDYSIRPPGGLPVGNLISSAPMGTTRCETNAWNGTGSTTWGNAAAFGASEPGVLAGWEDTVNPTVYMPAGGEHSQSLPYAYACGSSTCGPESIGSEHFGILKVNVASSITFRAPGSSPRSPSTKKTPPGPEFEPGKPVKCPPGAKPSCPDKKLAQEDLRSQLPGLVNECGIATLSTGLLVAGAAAPEIGIGSILAAAGPTGAEIFLLSGPVCVELVVRAYDDAKIVKDPPIGGLHSLARPVIRRGPAAKLAPCTPYAATIRTYCESLRRDALRYATLVRKGTAIDTALLTTVDRVSGAYKAHNGGALRLQVAQAARLRSQLKSAQAEQRRAGAAIVKLVKSVGLEATLSEGQEKAGIAKAFAGLSRRGVSGAQIQQIAGLSPSVASTDALASLSR